MKKLMVMITAVLLVFISASGCLRYKEYVPPEKLKKSDSGAMDVLTKDGTVYKLKKAFVSPKSITGHGMKFIDDNNTSVYFSGTIAIEDISLVQSHKKDKFGSLLASGVIGFLVINSMTDDTQSSGVRVDISYPSYGGGWLGGSCPYIFTFDGDDYRFESETFAGAICQGLERGNLEPLKFLEADDGILKMVLANQSPESQHVNEIGLLAVDYPKGSRVTTDARGGVHTITDEISPQSATAFDGRDVAAEIHAADGNYFEYTSDESQTSDIDLRDGLIVEFERPVDASQIKLNVTAVNTYLGYFALEKMFSQRGPNKLAWYHQLNTNPLEQKKLFNWVQREGWLEISLWENDSWVTAGWLPDFGPRKAGEKTVVMNIEHIQSENIKIKLESATDLWRIDCVTADYSDDLPVSIRPLSILTATNDMDEDVTHILNHKDSQYYSTLPGNFAMLEYEDVPPVENLSRTYLLKSSGYYYSWIEDEEEDNRQLVERILTEPRLGNKLYLDEWLNVKEKYAAFTKSEPEFKLIR